MSWARRLVQQAGGMLRRPRGLAALLAAVLMLWPDRAFAGGGGGDQSTTATVVAGILVIGFAYLMVGFLVEKFERRFLVMSGLEYVLLGVALGPHNPYFQVFDDLTGLMPIIALAAGWVGLLGGMQGEFKEAHPDGAEKSVFVMSMQVLFGGGAVAAGIYFLFKDALPAMGFAWAGQVDQDTLMICAGMLGCAAGTGATHPFDLLAFRYKMNGRVSKLLRRSASLDDIAAIIVFGALICWFRPEDAAEALGFGNWLLITVGVGAVLGALFRPFLSGDESENSRFLALVGIITFASGAAWLLRISPLLVNLVMGLVIINFAKSGRRIRATLQRTEQPLLIALLIMGGALWNPPPLGHAIIGTIGFIGLRLAGKMLGSALSALGDSELRRDTYRGLLAHGEVTVALAITFQLIYDGPMVDTAYTIALTSSVIHKLIAPRALRALLADAGEIDGTHRIVSTAPPSL